ncbi:hypothetical protein EI555_011596, partial [Monodon monoceros]
RLKMTTVRNFNKMKLKYSSLFYLSGQSPTNEHTNQSGYNLSWNSNFSPDKSGSDYKKGECQQQKKPVGPQGY